jgi:hypothetical protein
MSLFIANINFILYNTLDVVAAAKEGLRIAALIFLVLSILVNNKLFTVNRFDLLWIFLSCCSILSLNINPNLFNILYIIIFIIVSKNISTDTLIRKSFYVSLFCAVVIFVLLGFGIIQNVNYSVFDRERNTFGFHNVNTFGSFVYSISILYILSRDSVRWYHVIFSTAVIFLIYSFTDSRTSIFAFLIFIFVFGALQITQKWNVTRRYFTLLKLSIIVLAVIPLITSISSSIILDGYPNLDIITSYRLSINSKYIMDNSLANWTFGGSTLTDVDNGYLTLIFSTGILFTMTVVIFVLIALRNFMNIKDFKAVAFVISFLYFSAFEALMIRPEVAITICFWLLIYRSIVSEPQTGGRK